MKEEMKNSIYSVLYLIDVLGNVDFLSINNDKVNLLREALLASVKKEKCQSAVNEVQGNDVRKEEIKKSIYSLLNLIDFLETVDFLTVDYDKVNQLRGILFAGIKKQKDPSAVEEAQEDFEKPATEKAKPSNFMNMWFNYFERCGKERNKRIATE